MHVSKPLVGVVSFKGAEGLHVSSQVVLLVSNCTLDEIWGAFRMHGEHEKRTYKEKKPFRKYTT
jgi:hypothetical protein